MRSCLSGMAYLNQGLRPMSAERSESGAPIHRYKPRETGWVPPDMADNSIDAISNHVEAHIGPIATVWHEIMSDLVHVDVHQVAPTADRPYWTLVTSGMSDKPMAAPPGREAWRFAELMLCLPAEWKMMETDFKDSANYWPIRWLKILARFPHEYKTWLCWGHSMPNGDPAEPLDSSVPFDGVMLLRPQTVPKEFWSLKIRDDKVIQLFSVIPLFPGEMRLKLKEGAETLEKRFEQRKVSEIVDPFRPDVSKKEWWRMW